MALAQRTENNFKISKKFAPLLQPIWRHAALFGGRASSKSHSVATLSVILAYNAKFDAPEFIVYCRQFQSSIKNSSKKLVEDKIKELGYLKDFTINEREIICKRNGSSFVFIGLERNLNNNRSLEGATLTIIEEAQDIKQESIDMLIPTVLRSIKIKSRIWWVWNPIKKDAPVDKMFLHDEPPPDSYIKKISWRDNPYFEMTGLKDTLEHLKKTDLKKYLHVWEGEYYDSDTARIITNVEIADIEVPDTVRPQFGLDFGSNKDPNAFVKLYVNTQEKWIYIASEFYKPCDLDELDDNLKDIADVRTGTIVADGSWPQSISVLKGKGYRVVPAKKGPGSIIDGIKWLQGFKIIISPYCKNMIEEARLYSWQVDKYTNTVLNVPSDTFNHCWDAVRYATEQNRAKTGRISIMRF